MNLTKKQRQKKVWKAIAVLLALAIAYLWFYLTFGFGIPCLFHKLTGLLCPGCGMTRAMAQLWQGNVEQAYRYNALCISVIPVLAVYLLYRTVRYIKGNEHKFYIWEYVVLIVLWIVTIGYGISRNFF